MQPIDLALENLKLPGFNIRSISPLDPSGWVRVGLDRDGNAPLQFNAMKETVPAAGPPSTASIQPGTNDRPGTLQH